MDDQEDTALNTTANSEICETLSSAAKLISDALPANSASDTPRKLLETRTISNQNKSSGSGNSQDKSRKMYLPQSSPRLRLMSNDSNGSNTAEKAGTFSFVNLLPVDATAIPSSSKGSADKSNARPSYIIQLAPNSEAKEGSASGSTAASTNGLQTVQSVFRLVALNDGKAGTAGKAGTQKFALNRVSGPDAPKVIVIPAPGVSIAPTTSTTVRPTKIVKVADRRDTSAVSSAVAKPNDVVVLSGKPEVLPLLSILPRSTIWTNLVGAYELSGLTARCSVEKEKKVVKDLEKLRCVYEDTQFVWKPLPAPEPMEVPGVSSTKVGDLLSIGRFIEILQYEHKPTRNKRKRFDYEFLVNAVLLRDGNIGAYLSVLNWFVWAFDERKDFESKLHIPPEFTVSVQKLAGDHILACETLRQYMVVVKKYKEIPYPEEFLVILEKLKYVDVADFTPEERIMLLNMAHKILIQDTGFVNACLGRLEQECAQAMDKRMRLDAAVRARELALLEMEEKLKLFDERSKATRSEDRERTYISDEIKTVTKDIEKLNAEKVEAETEGEEAKIFSGYMSHSDCLGYDRQFNRYWHFPELCSGLLVESGWSSPVYPKKLDLTANPLPTVLSNFVYPNRPQEPYYLQPDGKYRKCDSRLIFPPSAANAWTMYDAKSIPHLIAQLNPMGIREGRLKMRLQADIQKLSQTSARPLPNIAEGLLAILKDFFAKVFADLADNQFLIKSVDPDWKEKLDCADLAEFKQFIVWVFSAISPVLMHKEFHTMMEKTWKTVVEETMNLSRIYYLCKLLDNCIRWERRIGNEQCKLCGIKQRRNRMRRCYGCASVFHYDDCMDFTPENLCGDCVVMSADSAARNVVVVQKMSTTPEAENGEKKVDAHEGTPLAPCVDFSELTSEEGTPEKKRRSSTGSLGTPVKYPRLEEPLEPSTDNDQRISVQPDPALDNSPSE
ncbi:tyrosine-protein kinase BAZ1B-like isoform X2 [Paramacrobiotus metropolitanus]|uniref:tyrosine-protein kinase BAZ1B-like isoform X2 n=1 Tax=Paramacrobiotus metropolitanus TaxID=2943436 RepID=UPI002445FD64|nr:tyrosine-protein kinase BAZ1B-like isoform X2 [Paramacrobiotus metropolitanus]